MEAKLTRVEANKTLRDKIVHMRGVEEREHTAYMELSDKYALSVS